MKKTLSGKTFDVINVIFMVLLCVVMIYPYLNQLAVSLNDGADTMLGGLTIYPRKPTWTNYRTIFTNQSILTSSVVTVITVILSTVLTLIVCVGAAYTVKKKDLPFRNAIIWFLLIPNYISAGVIPVFILYRYLHLMNNILVYILPSAFTFYNVIIIRTFLSSIPMALEESAYVEGANELQILWKIILPLCKPVLATVALWTMVASWNDWTTTLYYVNEPSRFKLQYVIMQIIKQSEIVQKMTIEAAMTGGTSTKARPTSESVKAAAIIFSTLPIVMTYPFLQKYFVKGVTIGAVKD